MKILLLWFLYSENFLRTMSARNSSDTHTDIGIYTYTDTDTHRDTDTGRQYHRHSRILLN